MKAPFARSSPDLMAAVWLATLGLIVAVGPFDTSLRVVALAPMVIGLPGYALAAALFLPGSLPAAERSVYVVALSISVAAISGVLVQLVLGLERPVWAVLLFLVTAGASAVALARRDRLGGGAAPPRIAVPRLNPLSLLAILAATAIAAWAISISSEGAREERDEVRFAELWVLPQGPAGSASGEARRVSIGVSNHEGRPTAYRVRADHRAVLGDWRLSLGEDRRWRVSLPVPAISASEPLLVTLLKGGEVYRRAYLRSGLVS